MREFFAGPKEVIIYEPNIVMINDLNSNFYIKENMVKEKMRREMAVINKLKELNPYVKCNFLENSEFKNKVEEILFLLEIIKNFSFIIITEFITKYYRQNIWKM